MTNAKSTQPLRPAVEWDEIPNNPAELPFLILVEGLQGSGKTHLAMTFPEPIFILDTENRSDKVAAKFAGAKQIYRKKINSFDDFRQTLFQLVYPNFSSGTIVIDSGSDLQSYAEAEFLQETRKEKIWPQVLWTEVFKKVIGLLYSIRDHGFYGVITGRLKDEYVGDFGEGKKTGQLVFEGYKRMPYQVDIHLRLPGDGNAAVLKNGFRKTAIEQPEPLADPSFHTIINKLIEANISTKAELEKIRPESSKTSPTEAPHEAEKHFEGKDTTESVNEPQTPNKADTGENSDPNQQANGDKVADREVVKRVYNHGLNLGLEQGSIKMLLNEIRGEPNSNGMTESEVDRWLEAMNKMAEEYEIANQEASHA